MKSVLLLGRNIELSELSKSQLKGITIGESLAFRFFEGEVNGESMLFVEPKKNVPTPRSLSITSSRLAILFKKAVVFILSACPAYERQCIIDKGVFFIVSDKFAHLPNLVMNERIRMTAPSERLTPVAQYLLLYHLQWKDIRKNDLLVCPNRFDGNVIIEVWKYPSVKMMDENSSWVDRLSLAISLREDEDSRVEGEVKQLIDETVWKD